MRDNRGPELLAVNIVFCVIAGCIVTLRCITRIWLVRAFGVDDWLMVLASVIKDNDLLVLLVKLISNW